MNTPKAAPVVVEAAEREKFEAWYARTYWLNEDDEERARAFKDPSWTRLIEDAWVVWWARATLARPAEVAQVVGMPSNVREFVSDVADDTMLNNELRAWAHRLIAEDDAATRAPVAVGVEPMEQFSGPKKWTDDEVAQGNMGIRWINVHGVAGRPTLHDVREYVERNFDQILCECNACLRFTTPPAAAGLSVGASREQHEALNRALLRSSTIIYPANAETKVVPVAEPVGAPTLAARLVRASNNILKGRADLGDSNVCAIAAEIFATPSVPAVGIEQDSVHSDSGDGVQVDAAREAGNALILAIEAKAKVIYESWSGDPQYRPWQDGGNSLKQDEARRLARDAMQAGKGAL